MQSRLPEVYSHSAPRLLHGKSLYVFHHLTLRWPRVWPKFLCPLNLNSCVSMNSLSLHRLNGSPSDSFLPPPPFFTCILPSSTHLLCFRTQPFYSLSLFFTSLPLSSPSLQTQPPLLPPIITNTLAIASTVKLLQPHNTTYTQRSKQDNTLNEPFWMAHSN